MLATHTISAQVTLPGGIPISKPKRPNKPNGTDARTPGNTDVGTPEDVATNPNAPQDYDANLNVNDSAIATDRFRDLQTVRILAKSGAAYKADLKAKWDASPRGTTMSSDDLLDVAKSDSLNIKLWIAVQKKSASQKQWDNAADKKFHALEDDFDSTFK